MRSINILRSFIRSNPNNELDVSQIVSTECFQAWMQRRERTTPEADGRRFHRTIIHHVAGTVRCLLCSTYKLTPCDRMEDARLLQRKRRQSSCCCGKNSHGLVLQIRPRFPTWEDNVVQRVTTKRCNNMNNHSKLVLT